MDLGLIVVILAALGALIFVLMYTRMLDDFRKSDDNKGDTPVVKDGPEPTPAPAPEVKEVLPEVVAVETPAPAPAVKKTRTRKPAAMTTTSKPAVKKASTKKTK